MLAERLVAIVAGALLGIAASWFVLPVRSVDVLRRRLADVLTALGAVLSPVDPDAAPGERARWIAAFRASVARVEQLAPAHRAARAVAGRRVRAIDCIEAAAALPAALEERLAGRASGATARDGERLRAAISTARRSLTAPPDLGRVHEAFAALVVTLRGGPAS